MKYVKVGNYTFPVGEVFEVNRGEVSPAAIAAVTSYLAEYFKDEGASLSPALSRYLRDNYYREFIVTSDSDSEESESDVTMNWSTDKSRGKVVTRLAKYFYKRFGYKLPSAQKAEIGNIINEMGGGDGYKLLIRRGMDWLPGSYGDRYSCFWGSRFQDRNALNDEDVFYSVRVLRSAAWSPKPEEDNGLARCLLYFPLGVDNGMALVFNGYGMASRTFVDVLSQPFGDGRRSVSVPVKIEMTGYHRTHSVYINPASSYAIYPDGVPMSSNMTLLFDGAEKHVNVSYISHDHDVFGVCSLCGKRALVRSAITGDSLIPQHVVEHFLALGFESWEIPDTMSVTPSCASCGQENLRFYGVRNVSVPLDRATLRMVEFYGTCRYVLADRDEPCAYPLYRSFNQRELFLISYMESFHVLSQDGSSSVVYVNPSDVPRFRDEYVWDAYMWRWVRKQVVKTDRPMSVFDNQGRN